MFTVRIYGYDDHAQREVLLEEHDFTSGVDALECISEQEAGKRAELWAAV
jgi:hypothetical protein